MSENNKKTFSSLVDSDSLYALKMFCLQRNIPMNKWLQDAIDSTLHPAEQAAADGPMYPVLESHPADKKDWLMANLDNAHTINAIKAGCEEWLQLIKLWNRGDLQYEKLKAVIAQ